MFLLSIATRSQVKNVLCPVSQSVSLSATPTVHGTALTDRSMMNKTSLTSSSNPANRELLNTVEHQTCSSSYFVGLSLFAFHCQVKHFECRICASIFLFFN